MPRMKSLTREDPARVAIREEIYGILGSLKISQAELAKMTGIKASTLSNRIGKHGDIGNLRLDELIAIRRVAKERGIRGELK